MGFHVRNNNPSHRRDGAKVDDWCRDCHGVISLLDLFSFGENTPNR